MASTVWSLPKRTLAVSELNRYLKYLLEKDELLSALSVTGEISDFSRSPSGHVYFTLKDSSSQVSCVMFRREATQNAEVVRDLRRGLSIDVHGFLTLYEPRGTYQVFVERVVIQGEGTLARNFEQLRARLELEGLFAEDRKRALPAFPSTLALITSPGSQAYHDVLHRLRTQYPFARVVEVGVSVQGPGAADEMCMAIDIVNRLTDCDLILLVRGGGAPEELAAFNDERLARSVFGSRIPVVTGIGHQTDQSIADLVADCRAATPSLAATVAVPDVQAIVRHMRSLHRSSTLAVRERLSQNRQELVNLSRALLRANPEQRLRRQRRQARQQQLEMVRVTGNLLERHRDNLSALKAQLNALDPLAILARGYAVVTDVSSGAVITHKAQATPHSALKVRVAVGEFTVRVDDA